MGVSRRMGVWLKSGRDHPNERDRPRIRVQTKGAERRKLTARRASPAATRRPPQGGPPSGSSTCARKYKRVVQVPRCSGSSTCAVMRGIAGSRRRPPAAQAQGWGPMPSLRPQSAAKLPLAAYWKHLQLTGDMPRRLAAGHWGQQRGLTGGRRGCRRCPRPSCRRPAR